MKSLLYGKLEYFTIVKGVGTGSTFLNAFDKALIDAGVGNFNLVRVSSILPPGVRETKRIELPPGHILPIAYGYAYSAEYGERVTAAISVGIPESPEEVGVIMEYSGDLDEKEARDFVYHMAKEAMENRGIKIKKIVVEVSSTMVEGKTCVFAGVAVW